MRIGLIHAMISSVEPINTAFRQIAPEVELVHLMDTELLPLLQQEQALTPALIRRFSTLTNLAAESNVDCILLTCSAFNDLTEVLQPFYAAKLFRSDEAMLDRALSFERIGLISTVNETPPVLLNYLKCKQPNVDVETVVNTEALQRLLRGDQLAHDEMVQEMVKGMESKVDVIVLAQYSMAHVAKQMKDIGVPILTGPEESVKRCLNY